MTMSLLVPLGLLIKYKGGIEAVDTLSSMILRPPSTGLWMPLSSSLQWVQAPETSDPVPQASLS